MKSESPVLALNLPNYPVKGGLFFTYDQWGSKLWAIKQQPESQNMEVAENGFEHNPSNPNYVSFMLSLLILKVPITINVVVIIWYQDQ